MMKLRGALVLGVAALALASCGKGGKEPSGQVVATIGKEEVTAIDLRNEMGNFKAPNAEVRKAAERAALDTIINRKLLAAAAKEQEIDKTPEYAQQKAKMEELVLVRTWQDKLVKSVPPPSRDEVNNFVSAHPDLYAQRKVFGVDQIVFARPQNTAMLGELRPFKTFAEITQWLQSKGIAYRSNTEQLDAFVVPPELVEQVTKMPPGELFVLPAGNLISVNQIRETRVQPVSADAATRHATQYLTTKRTREAVQRQMASTIAAGRKEVKFAKAYEPAPVPAKSPPKPASAQPPAPAAAQPKI